MQAPRQHSTILPTPATFAPRGSFTGPTMVGLAADGAPWNVDIPLLASSRMWSQWFVIFSLLVFFLSSSSFLLFFFFSSSFLLLFVFLPLFEGRVGVPRRPFEGRVDASPAKVARARFSSPFAAAVEASSLTNAALRAGALVARCRRAWREGLPVRLRRCSASRAA